mmetsp:Transcript_4339/g.9381  ORF Transcript_4339/g.9381 Transcript_4339/m.9381 type:complete len:223 (+) Transcript_4339:307-975(+)
MHSEHFLVVFLVDHDLRKPIGVVSHLGKRPFERQKFPVVHLDPILSVLLDGVILGETDAGIFDRREHGGADVHVVHGFLGTGKETARQGDARLDGNGCELRATLHDVSDRINVGARGLFERGGYFSILWIGGYADGLEIELGGIGGSANGRQDRVVHIVRSVGKGHPDAIALHGFEFGGCDPHLESDAVVLHVIPDSFGALAIESPQQDAAHRTRHVLSQAG